MRAHPFLIVAVLVAGLAPPAAAQALRNPADPPPAGTLRPVEPVRQLPRDVTAPVSPIPALSPRERCLQNAERMVQPLADQRIASAQRGMAAAETRRAATGADATDPMDTSGLRAQRDAQQRAMARERDAAAQQLALARANCR